MKIKRYLILFIILLNTLIACEPSHLEDNLPGSVIYFSRSGEVAALVYDVEDNSTYNIYAINPGFYRGSAEIKVTVDPTIIESLNESKNSEIKLFPADCYTIPKATGTISNDNDTCKIAVKFNNEKIFALSEQEDFGDLKDYAIPVRLSVEGEIPMSDNEELTTLLIRPEIKNVHVKIKNSEEITVLKSEMAETLSFEFTVLTTLENKWESSFDVLLGDEAISHINSTLQRRGTLDAYSNMKSLPSDAYTIDFKNTMSAGTTERIAKITVDPTKIPDGFSSIALFLKGGTVRGRDITVEGSPLMIVNFENVTPISTKEIISVVSTTWDSDFLGKYLTDFGYTLLPRTDWIFAPESYHGTTQKNAIDGNTSSQWENRYGTSGAGPTKSLPFDGIIDLGKVEQFSALEVWRRAHVTYVSDLRGFEIYISDDGDKWKYITSVDYGIGANERAMYTLLPELSARYVNLYMTKSNRGAVVSVAEIHLWNK